jgi:hypothetical protein
MRSGSDVAGNLVAGYLADAPPAQTRLEDLLDLAPELVSMFSCGRTLPLDERMPYAALTSFPPDAGVLDPYTAATGRVLYFVRDPRSLVAEMVLMSRASGAQRAQMAAKLIARIGAAGEGGKTWQAHVRDWTSPERARARFPGLVDISVVRFEDLQRDPAGVLRQVIDFLGVPEPVDDARARRAVRDWTLEKVGASALLEVPPGVSAFRDPPPPHPQLPGTLPSLGELGEEVEAAYQQRLRDNAEFAALVSRFGYEG